MQQELSQKQNHQTKSKEQAMCFTREMLATDGMVHAKLLA